MDRTIEGVVLDKFVMESYVGLVIRTGNTFHKLKDRMYYSVYNNDVIYIDAVRLVVNDVVRITVNEHDNLVSVSVVGGEGYD